MKNSVHDKSKAFALRIIKLRRYLCNDAPIREFDLSKQLIRSGTSIGANVRESRNAQSTADFISKMSIALKEADESEYWLELLQESEYLTQEQGDSLLYDCRELIKMLTSIIKTSKEKPQPK